MQTTTACLDEHTLQRLASGQVPGQEAEPLERHLRDCPACSAAYDALFAPLIESLRVWETTETPSPDQDQIDELIARAERLPKPGLPGRLGPYSVLRVLGEGGMGTVYEAEDKVLGRRVAVKVIKAGAVRPETLRRFLREARAAAALDHENIVPVLHFGEHEGAPFLAMPFLKGETLAARLGRDRRLPMQLVLNVGRDVASGLAAANAVGLVHRDIKPGNLWLEDRPEGPRVRILDFGLASTENTGGQPLTLLGTPLGTPEYMAPEQARGEAVDGRADLFSLGCVLYESATGRRPFGGGSPLAVMAAVAGEHPSPPHEVDAAVPVGLSELVMLLLQKQRENRTASAQELAKQLQRLEAQPVSPRVVEQVGPQLVSRPTRWRHSVLIVVAMALAPAGYFFGGTVIDVACNQGKVVIEWDDPNVEVTVKKGGVVILDGKSGRTATVTAGEQDLEVSVKDGKGELTFFTTRFTLSRGGMKVIEVRRELAEAEKLKPAAAPQRQAAEWVLSVGGWCEVAADGKRQEVREAKALPQGAFEVTGVTLSDTRITDGDLKRLSELTGLAKLGLNRTRVGDEGLAHLGGLSRLRFIGLVETAVTGKGLAELPVGLEQIELAGAKRLNDSALEPLKRMRNLKSLSLQGTPVKGDGLAHLPLSLEALALDQTEVSDAGLTHLKRLNGLRVVSLNLTPVTGTGLKHLPVGLGHLQLGLSKVNDAGLLGLGHLGSLEFLNLTGTEVTDAGLAALRGLRPNRIHLDATKVSAAGIRELKKALPGCLIYSDWGMAPEDERKAAEWALSAGGWCEVAADGKKQEVREAKALPHGAFEVTGVVLTGAPITDGELVRLERVVGPRLIDLTATPVTDAGLAHLAELKKLETLKLGRTGVTDAGLARLHGLTALRRLDLTGTKVSSRGVAALRKALPNCRVVGAKEEK